MTCNFENRWRRKRGNEALSRKTHMAKISAREPKNIIVRHPSVRLFWNPLNIKKNKPTNTAIRTMARIIPPATVSIVLCLTP